MSNVMRSYITQNKPFGPTDAGNIGADETKALSSLFELNSWDNNKFPDRPTVIVGRQGSGKTHYLRSMIFENQYAYYTELRATRLFAHVAKIVQEVTKSDLFFDTVAEVWEMILWIIVFSELRKYSLLSYDDLSIINAYLQKVGVKENDSVDHVLLATANTLYEGTKRRPTAVVSETIRRFGNITFDDAKALTMRNLELSGKNFVIMMDFLDNFPVDFDLVSRSLGGLLKQVGSMNKPRDIVDVRLCLPWEFYYHLVKLSSNPNKDFRRAFLIHWSVENLLQVGAQRLKCYLELYHQNFLEKLPPFDFSKKEDVVRLYQSVLPRKVTTIFGHDEDTLIYILRHTQLLPRHFLLLLNSIFSSLNLTKSSSPFPVSNERILNSVHEVKESIVNEIFAACTLAHPTAKATCLCCLPELSDRFTVTELDRVFNRYGKTAFKSGDLYELQRMLLEIGVIGRVIHSSETGIYLTGSFEYMISKEVVLKEDDEICIHPLFSGLVKHTRLTERPVLPSGNALYDEDNTGSSEQ